MSVVGVGVLQAALEAQGAPALVLSGKHALALTSAARDMLTEFFDYPPAPAAPPLSQPVLDFAAVVLDAKGASLTTEVSASEGRKMKMTGAAHTDAATGQSLVILTLEKVLRRWDMFMDPKVGSVVFIHLGLHNNSDASAHSTGIACSRRIGRISSMWASGATPRKSKTCSSSRSTTPPHALWVSVTRANSFPERATSSWGTGGRRRTASRGRRRCGGRAARATPSNGTPSVASYAHRYVCHPLVSVHQRLCGWNGSFVLIMCHYITGNLPSAGHRVPRPRRQQPVPHHRHRRGCH